MFASKYGQLKGTGIGIGLSFAIGAFFMSLSSVFHAQQNELIAYMCLHSLKYKKVFF